MQRVIENFLEYIKINTISDEESQTCPSTKSQLILAQKLAQQCKSIGLTEIALDENGYISATIDSNIDKEVPVIGFIAHMDTSPDMSGENVNAKLVESYDGKDIVLNEQKKIILSPNEFPELKNYVGKTLITTDGNTLLGADDKAGIAEIMAAAEFIVKNKDFKHGKIKICFTPDEEIGRGADRFDVKKFGADFAYTLDGGKIGELEFENFNAAQAKICIHGKNVHPGTAKNTMVNSIFIANELISKFPKNERPETTESYEGFYHLTEFKGSVEQTNLKYIIRDFDIDSFNKRKQFITNIVNELNTKYKNKIIELSIKDQYFNMVEKINENKFVVDLAFNAMKAVGVEPIIQPIRGGTDGSKLSFMGLPCPNIFVGGHNYHGKYEFIPTYSMEKAVDVILKIVELSTGL